MHLRGNQLLMRAFIIIHGKLSGNPLFPTGYKYIVFTILLWLIIHHHVLGRPACKASGLVITIIEVVEIVV